MFPCAGSSVDLVARLQNRLNSAKSIAKQSNKLEANFADIESEMMKLGDRLLGVKKDEDGAMELLNTVTRTLDEMLDHNVSDLHVWESNLKVIKTAITDAMKYYNKEPAVTGAEGIDVLPLEQEEVDVVFPEEWKLQEGPVWAHLKLVVDSMEKQLKLCLFSLTVFPPDAVIKKRLLFHWWMAEEFVKDPDEGNGCFKELIEKGFVIPLKKRHCRKWHYCKVQVWLRRLFIAVAASNAFLEYDDVGGLPSNDFTRSPRACLRLNKQLIRLEEEVEADRRLKVIFNVSCRGIELNAEWLVNKSGLVAMQLGRWKEASPEDKALHVEVRSDEFLKGIGNCQKLKYISLRGVSRVEMLDKSIGKLDNLVVLDLRACHNLEKLPEEVGSAKKLQFLDVSECYLLDQMPTSLANLNELQVLKGFVVGDFQNKNICQIANLVKLRVLRKLSINLGREFRDEEVAKLGELKGLTSLTIVWGVVVPREQAQDMPDREKSVQQQTAKAPPVLEQAPAKAPLVLAPPPGLTKLELWCFTKKNLPEWISPRKLPKLEKMYIRGGKLRTLGDEKGWTVEVLRLRFLKHFEQDWRNLTSSFPNLKYVTASGCRRLDEGKPAWPLRPGGAEDDDDDDDEVNFRPDDKYWDSKMENDGKE